MKRHFSMMELIAVITISSILVALVAPALRTDRAQLEQSRIGGLFMLAMSMHIKESKPVKVTIEGGICKAELINGDNSTTLIKMFVMPEKVECKIERDGIELNSMTATRQGFGAGSEYYIKIRNKNTSENPLIVRVNGFTGKVSYYLREGEVVTW